MRLIAVQSPLLSAGCTLFSSMCLLAQGIRA
jgi:hypothetical protein